VDKKVLALDIGNKWTGIACSDFTGTFARPLTTVATRELVDFLTKKFQEEEIAEVVVGHPITMRGTASEQTIIVEKMTEQLRIKFPAHKWVLWDERLSSQRAMAGRTRTPEDKLREHARAAAYVLDLYLTYRTNYSQDALDRPE